MLYSLNIHAAQKFTLHLFSNVKAVVIFCYFFHLELFVKDLGIRHPHLSQVRKLDFNFKRKC